MISAVQKLSSTNCFLFSLTLSFSFSLCCMINMSAERDLGPVCQAPTRNKAKMKKKKKAKKNPVDQVNKNERSREREEDK